MKFLNFMYVCWCIVTMFCMLFMALGKIEPQYVLIPLVWQFYTHWQIKEKEKE